MTHNYFAALDFSLIQLLAFSARNIWLIGSFFHDRLDETRYQLNDGRVVNRAALLAMLA
jgi:hypothetical protein